MTTLHQKRVRIKMSTTGFFIFVFMAVITGYQVHSGSYGSATFSGLMAIFLALSVVLESRYVVVVAREEKTEIKNDAATKV